MTSKRKHYLSQAIKILVAVGLVYWLWSSGKLDFSSLKYFLAPQWAFLGLALIGINLYFCSERWRILLQMQNRPTSRSSAFNLSLIGLFFNYAMPGGVGGDVVKAYYFHKDHADSKIIALTSVLIDRVLGLYAMMLTGVLVMLYDWNHISQTAQLKSLFYADLLLTLMATGGLYMLFSEKLHRSGFIHRTIGYLPLATKLHKLYDSFHRYGRSPKDLGKVLILSWLAQAFSIFYLILAGELSGADAPWATYFLVGPLGFIAMGLPISPAGIGVGQAAFYYLFNLYLGTVSTLGPTTITAFQVGQLVWGLAGATIYLRKKQPLQTDFAATAESNENSDTAVEA
jgi:uncharacterized protein (TIRG00374 family)